MSPGLISLLFAVAAAAPPAIPHDDRIRLQEVFALMANVQDEVWPRWSQAPADIVFVGDELEYLMRSRAQPPGFAALTPVPSLGPSLLARKRTFNPSFLATFPAFGPTPTIVVGTPRATGKSSTAWVLIVLHEHFHQLQYSDATYWKETRDLDLSGGDETGMWMLNYPFPYAAVSARFASLSTELAGLLDGDSAPSAAQRDEFWRKYAELGASLAPRDYRYLSLQLWQEGIARYVELRTAEVAAKEHRLSREFAALPDAQPLTEAAASLRRGIREGLRAETMEKDQRIVFYAFGAGLGLLLDLEGASWKSRYLREKFYLESYRRSPVKRKSQ